MSDNSQPSTPSTSTTTPSTTTPSTLTASPEPINLSEERKMQQQQIGVWIA